MIGPNSKDRICLNPDCLDYRKRKAGNIIKKGFNAKGNQMSKCKSCGVRFPETKGTVSQNWSEKVSASRNARHQNDSLLTRNRIAR